MRTGEVVLTVERIPDGEVSTYLHDVVVPGDRVELRGPIGGYFVWEASLGGPLLLVAGGSGVVPLLAMLRHRAGAGVARADGARLLVADARRRHRVRRARGARGRRPGAARAAHVDAVAAAGLDRATRAGSTATC